MYRQYGIGGRLVLGLVMTGTLCGLSGPALAGKKTADVRTSEPARLVVRYVESLAHGRVSDWATLDVGCQAQRRSQGPSEQADRRCWEETLRVHRDLLADQPETGIFGAVGRGAGLGLLSETHRHADNWKDYMPAIFASPVVLGQDAGSDLKVQVLKVWPARTYALLQLAGEDPVGVPGHTVDLRLSYQDPLTAPLALWPEEAWWATGAQRRYGPVKEVTVRFVVVTGLRQHGFSADRGILNEALPGAPGIAGIQYGHLPQRGRTAVSPEDDVKARVGAGGFVVGSARWWQQTDAPDIFAQALTRATHMPRSIERSGILTRLAMIDPADPALHTVIADDRFHTFLTEGLAKSGIAGSDEAVSRRLAELFWNLQAQTWRQELTDVAMGHSRAAEAFYQAIGSLERMTASDQASVEQRRQLGALYRWNNDTDAALAVHQALLKDTAPTGVLHGRLTAELAWDRLQWLSWERRYSHPWLEQASREAEEALRHVEAPVDKLMAAYALVLVEALRVPHDSARLHEQVQLVKSWHDHLPGVVGLWPYMVGNDVVKALLPEGAQVMLPTPVRAPDVQDVQIHAQPQRQDIVWQWNFDQDVPDALPGGFTAMSTPGAERAAWRVVSKGAPKPGHQVVQDRSCGSVECAHLLVADRIRATFPDITVQLEVVSPGGEAGLALAVRDNRNFYTVTLNPSTGILTTRRIADGLATIVGETAVKLASRPSHTLRVQRINFLHLDRGRLSVFVDGAQVAAVADQLLPQDGRIGLVTYGDSAATFDGLHLLDLVSNRTMSLPAAY